VAELETAAMEVLNKADDLGIGYNGLMGAALRQLHAAMAPAASDMNGCDPIREGSQETPEWENNPR
jgi:hypothetical protein